MALVVVDTNMISFLVKLKHGRLGKDEERAKKYEQFLKGKDMARAFPTEAELNVWLQKLPEGDRKEKYGKGIREFMDQTAFIDGTDIVSQEWAKIIAAGGKAGRIHVRDKGNPKRDAQLNDTWIAACALAHGLPLVSDNWRDFEWMKPTLGLDLVCYSGSGATKTDAMSAGAGNSLRPED